ncbi:MULTISPECIES: STAS domain-containing protein [Actinomycetospora]|uniref:STAS domain-containing protein n=1 Tax=Actinomycetospora TaxID=402649 RepID=UPI001E2971C0|nr:STAS domain-containing protein [Actinomycetospora soli]MCD2191043.1 STAS domain-containing protein [Actinomycetospora soli]
MTDSAGNGGREAVATEEEFSTEEPMGVDVRRSGETSVIRLTGEIDMLTTPALRAKVTEELAAGLSVLVLDMLAVEFLGSSGLALLVEALDESRNRGVALRLVADSRPVSRPLQATGLTDLFEIHTTVEDALAA